MYLLFANAVFSVFFSAGAVGMGGVGRLMSYSPVAPGQPGNALLTESSSFITTESGSVLTTER